MDEISAVRSGVASCQQVTNARKRRENSDCVCDLQVVSKLNKNLKYDINKRQAGRILV